MTTEELQSKIVELERKVEDLIHWRDTQNARDKIVVVGPVDASYNIPVLANGKRRNIATSAA